MHRNNEIIGIIGYGRLGSSLSYALFKKNYKVYVYSLNIEKKLIPTKFFANSLFELVKSTNIIFICVPDENIELLANNIAELNIKLDNKIIFHTSGAKTSDSLIILKDKNACIASFHPLQSLPAPLPSLKIWRNIYCIIEGDEKAIKKAKEFCQNLKCKFLILSKENKIFYHAAAVVASNFLVLLIDISQKLSSYANIDKSNYSNLYFPLIKATLSNIENLGCYNALSGPLVRKDYTTLLNQIEKIKEKNITISQLYNLFIEYYKYTFNKNNN